MSQIHLFKKYSYSIGPCASAPPKKSSKKIKEHKQKQKKKQNKNKLQKNLFKITIQNVDEQWIQFTDLFA